MKKGTLRTNSGVLPVEAVQGRGRRCGLQERVPEQQAHDLTQVWRDHLDSSRGGATPWNVGLQEPREGGLLQANPKEGGRAVHSLVGLLCCWAGAPPQEAKGVEGRLPRRSARAPAEEERAAPREGSGKTCQ